MTATTNFLKPFSRSQQPLNPPTETLYPLRDKTGSMVIHKRLSPKSFIRLLGNHAGEQVTCLGGIAWLTEPGSLDDIFLSNGESFTITGKGPVLIQGMLDTRLEITAQPA